MIKTKTVFVLGAGASQPFNLPLGIELYQSVLENFSAGQHRQHLLNTTTFTETDIDHFLTALGKSGQTSVDAFLERRHEEFLDIGKAAMAIELILREQEWRLWRQPNWMLNLFGRMATETLEQFAQNEVAFVTFNYDCSLEHFLVTSMSNTFGKSISECAKALDDIPIIHLHGRLRYLLWQSKEGRAYIDSTVDHRTVGICVKEMRVVHEDITDRDKDFVEAKNCLRNAARIYLMGFGFGTKNIERIGLASLEPKVFQGTAYPLTPQETANCVALCGGRVALYNSLPCLEFLRNQVP